MATKPNAIAEAALGIGRGDGGQETAMNEPSRIRITDVKVVNLRVVEDVGALDPAWPVVSTMNFRRGGGAIVQVHTDQGIVGIGPAMDPRHLPAVKAHLVGKDPFDVEEHAAALRFYAYGAPYRGTAGVDIALWDIIGKACGQPLYKLWGGGEDRVTPYASMIILSTPEERAEMATRLMEEGWKAIKIRIHHATLAEDVRTIETVRDAVGDKMTIMVDANQAESNGTWQPGVQWDFRRAVDSALALQELGCYWLEEPLTGFEFERLADLNASVHMPIAGGEGLPGLHDFYRACQQNVYDILQPEVLVVHGATAMRKIGTLAEFHGKQIVPHNGGGGLGVIAHLHLVASWPHAPYLELLHEPPIGDYQHGFSIMQDPPLVDSDGYIPVPQGPGLGVEIDPDLIISE